MELLCTCSTPRAASTRWRTSPASGCGWSCPRCPPRRAARRAAALADLTAEEVAAATGASADAARRLAPELWRGAGAAGAGEAGAGAGAAAAAGAGADGAPRREAWTSASLAEHLGDVDAAVPDAGEGDPPARGPRVQRGLQRRSWRRCSTTELKLPGAQEGARPAPPPIRRCWRSSPSSTRCRAPSSSTASSPSSRAPTWTRCRRWWRRTAGSTPPSTRRRRRPGRLSSSRSEPPEHPDPHRAGPGDPPRLRRGGGAASSSPRTTARSSCGSWRTSPRTRR